MENGRFWRRSLLDLFCRDEGLLSVARSSDNAESAGERARTSIKGHSGKRPSIVRGHFPKLSDCAHFHYEAVDFGTLQLSLIDQQPEANDSAESLKDLRFLVKVDSQDREWLLRRSWEDFVILDSQLHQCIFDRRFSRLPDLSTISNPEADVEATTMELAAYLSRLSEIADNKVNCGPVLTWIEIDNKGHRLLAIDESVINVPAIAAARAVKRHSAQTGDELSLEVGDFVSVIEMPPKHETSWWRGKQSFKVGFFPSDCVQLINEQRIPSNPSVRRKSDFDAGVLNAGTRSPPLALLARDQSLRSGLKRHSSLMGFLLTFLKSRPSRQRLKQQGILKERVFGCDLGEHLLNSGLDVPQVLQSCSEFVEVHGIVDGIYRLSGISSNVQKLRHEFDSGHNPDLTRVTYLQDIHCVGSLCKLYFRELPNPLLTFQLYPHFAEAVSEGSDSVRLLKVHKVIQQLPPPHYRTLHYLLHHLSTMASYSKMTGMHVRNLAIVWAPNLLRSREVEGEEISGTEAFLEVRVQSVVVEFLLTHAHTLFTECPTPQTEG